MSNLLQMLEDWLRKPFDPNGNAGDWVLFLGFVVVVIILWRRIINKITTEA